MIVIYSTELTSHGRSFRMIASHVESGEEYIPNKSFNSLYELKASLPADSTLLTVEDFQQMVTESQNITELANKILVKSVPVKWWRRWFK
jgi:hypothetical protein